ncbi:MAG: DoxX family protein [Deltaproteobacteria bacterium]|nr:DoxX family protein [Deltaproteobacteria bacterium]
MKIKGLKSEYFVLLPHLGTFILRITIGLIYTIYGIQKVFGVWGGLNLSGTAVLLSGQYIPYPYYMAYFLGFSELIAGFAVLVGLKTRFCALVLSSITVIALVTVHFDQGIFIPDKGGFACPFPLLASCLALVCWGSGQYGLDIFFIEKSKRKI